MVIAKTISIGISVSVLCLVSAALAYESKYRQACTVSRGSYAPRRTICEIRSSMSQGAYLATVTLPDGKRFQISGNFGDTDQWEVNGRAAVIVNPNDLSRPCYRTADLELCIGR